MKSSASRIITIAITINITLMAGALGIEPADTVPDISMDLPMDSVGMFAINALSADINTNARPEPLYKTPEASAFQEYGKFGTGSADGSIDISIPIHTISCRDLQIPIALHYGGRGIKVAEEASWVGLGWDLSIGGCINYVPAGQYDFLVRNAQWSDYLRALSLDASSIFQTALDMKDQAVMEDLVNGLGERDFFSVNILGRCFLFFVNPWNESFTIIGADDSDWSISRSGKDAWMIRDSMGYAYEFQTLEYSDTESAGKQISAWYLSSVETPEGITALFSYDNTSVKCLPQAHQWYDAQRGDFNYVNSNGVSFSYDVPRFGSGASYGKFEVSKPWLKSITTENQKVIFETSVRTDFINARKLDWIKVMDLNGNVAYMYHFNYGIFSNSKIGGSCPDISKYLESEKRTGERLKLTKLSRMSIDRTDSLTHSFAYHEQHALPLKTSAAIDFWGYYNGQENFSNKNNPCITDERSIIPSLQDCTIGYNLPVALDQSSLAVPGACRFSDPEYILAGTLTSITYPTGGKSVFKFEPHRFRSSPVYPLHNEGYKKIEVDVQDLNYPSTPTNPGPVTSTRIDLSGQARGYLTVIFEARGGKTLRDLQRANSSVTLQPMASPSYKKILLTLDSCSNVNLDGTYHKETFPISLENVSYMLIANLPSEISFGGGWIDARLECLLLDPALESGGAGLRIAGISNYDDNGVLIGQREFEYKTADGTTSGKLIIGGRPTECRIKYLEHILDKVLEGSFTYRINAVFSVARVYSSFTGIPAITEALAHGPVGYSMITERELDGSGKILRSTVSEFNVTTSDEPLPDMHILHSTGGGEIKRRTILDTSGNVMLTEDFEYQNKSSTQVKCNISIEDQYYEYVTDSSWWSQHDAPRYLLRIYPYPSYWRVLSGITSREHTPQGIVESRKTFAYNELNRLVSEESMTSGGIGIRTTYKYSVDYPSTLPYSRMIPSPYYVRGIPVETTSYELNGGTYTEARKEKLTYSFNGNKADMLHVTRVDESVAGGTLQAREAFTYSDTDGTLVGTVKNTSDKRACLWSYAHTCPVAVIDGASYSEVESWVGAAFVKSLSAAKTGIESLLSQLRTKLNGKGVMLTTYTYKPLVGITSQTGPTGEKTTYEYDSFNRLSRVVDHNGKVLETYTYSYR